MRRDFEALNGCGAHQIATGAKGEKTFVNPRSAAAGAVRGWTGIAHSAGSTFLLTGWAERNGIRWPGASILRCSKPSKNGVFSCSQTSVALSGASELIAFHQRMGAGRDQLPTLLAWFYRSTAWRCSCRAWFFIDPRTAWAVAHKVPAQEQLKLLWPLTCRLARTGFT
jgi:DNA ligase (NAD+)